QHTEPDRLSTGALRHRGAKDRIRRRASAAPPPAQDGKTNAVDVEFVGSHVIADDELVTGSDEHLQASPRGRPRIESGLDIQLVSAQGGWQRLRRVRRDRAIGNVVGGRAKLT